MTISRRAAARVGIGMLLAVMVLAPIALAIHTVDVRNSRRDLNQTRVAALAEVAKANAERIAGICEVQNTDARRLNKVVDYFEKVSKMQNPGPATDAFWAGVPRPLIASCTSLRPTTKGTP